MTEFSQSNAGFRKFASPNDSIWDPEMGVGEYRALCLMLDLKKKDDPTNPKRASKAPRPAFHAVFARWLICVEPETGVGERPTLLLALDSVRTPAPDE